MSGTADKRPGGTIGLGESSVARIGYGCDAAGGPAGQARDSAVAVLLRAVELGVNHIDTAQFYGPGLANEVIHA